MNVTGNTILITGGTSGIGYGFAEEFLRLGNKVIICGRREERLNEIHQKHPEIVTRFCDLSDDLQRMELGEWVLQNFPDLNMLINNAGIQLLADLTHPVNMERIRSEVDINLIAPVHLASIFASRLSTRKDAAIVNISSGLAFSPLAFMPVYCATKAAIHSISMSLRHQLRNTSVKVFEIAPPAVDTELGSDRRSDKTQSHGGIPVQEFLEEAMHALRNDIYEFAVGQANNMRTKREELFDVMNNR